MILFEWLDKSILKEVGMHFKFGKIIRLEYNSTEVKS